MPAVAFIASAVTAIVTSVEPRSSGCGRVVRVIELGLRVAPASPLHRSVTTLRYRRRRLPQSAPFQDLEPARHAAHHIDEHEHFLACELHDLAVVVSCHPL